MASKFSYMTPVILQLFCSNDDIYLTPASKETHFSEHQHIFIHWVVYVFVCLFCYSYWMGESMLLFGYKMDFVWENVSMFNSKGREQIEEKISKEKEEGQSSELNKDVYLGVEGFQIYQIWVPNTRGLDGGRPRQSQRSLINEVMRNESISWLVRLI